jgi:putative flippase GtrA
MSKPVQQMITETFGVGIGAAILQAVARWLLHKPNATWQTFATDLASWVVASAVLFLVRYLWSKRARRHVG